MSRYFTRPRATKPLYVETELWPDARPQDHSVEVPDHEPHYTGLVDCNGDDIMRAPRGIGFHAEI